MMGYLSNATQLAIAVAMNRNYEIGHKRAKHRECKESIKRVKRRFVVVGLAHPTRHPSLH